MTALAEKLADELAAATIKHIDKTGDEEVVALMSKTLGASSQTLQEAFVTSIRVQRAAIRGRETLAQRAQDFEDGKIVPD